MLARILRIFAQRSTALPPAPARFPERGQAEAWMMERVAYLIARCPEDAHSVFDPSRLDYFPLVLHVGSNFGDAEIAAYRRVKGRFPGLVAKAHKSRSHLARSAVCDPEDVQHLPVWVE